MPWDFGCKINSHIFSETITHFLATKKEKNSFITNQVKYRYEYDFKRVKVFDTDFLGGNLSGHRVLSESSTLEPQKERG